MACNQKDFLVFKFNERPSFQVPGAEKVMGQRKGFAESDVMRINERYCTGGQGSPGLSPQGQGPSGLIPQGQGLGGPGIERPPGGVQTNFGPGNGHHSNGNRPPFYPNPDYYQYGGPQRPNGNFPHGPPPNYHYGGFPQYPDYGPDPFNPFGPHRPPHPGPPRPQFPRPFHKKLEKFKKRL